LVPHVGREVVRPGAGIMGDGQRLGLGLSDARTLGSAGFGGDHAGRNPDDHIRRGKPDGAIFAVT